MTPRMVSDDSCRDSSTPDYDSVELPSTSREEYGYVQRRAELLQLIREAGHPSELNQSELAERYDVSQQQISKDISRLGEYVHEQVADRDRRALVVDTTVRRVIRGLLDEEEWRAAAKTAMEYDEWATEFYDLDRLAEEVDRLKDTAGLSSGRR